MSNESENSAGHRNSTATLLFLQYLMMLSLPLWQGSIGPEPFGFPSIDRYLQAALRPLYHTVDITSCNMMALLHRSVLISRELLIDPHAVGKLSEDTEVSSLYY